MTRDRKGNYARMKESVRQEDIAILILCAPNNRAVKCEAKTNRTERRNRQIYNYSWRLHAGAMSSIPELGKSPGLGNGKPLQNSCLENSVDKGAWKM